MDQLIESKIICPITKMIFYDPVVAEDEFIYERDAISSWFKNNSISPITGKPISKNIVSVIPIKNMIKEYLEKHPVEKKNQYKPDLTHITNTKTIKQIIKKKEYDKLLAYTDFSMKEFFSYDDDIFLVIWDTAPPKVQKYIIDNCIDIETQHINSSRLVHFVCQISNADVVTYIFKKAKIDLECINKYNRKPIHCVCENPKLTYDLIKYAINKVKDLESRDIYGHTPFQYVCIKHYDKPKLIKYFIDNVLKLDEKSKKKNKK